MKRVIFAAMLMLAGCNQGSDAINSNGSALPVPSNLADQTKLDETAALGFETAVAVAADLATLAVKTHAIKGTTNLERLRAAGEKARLAVASVRAAYNAGNADNYATAIEQAQVSIDDVRALAMGDVH